MLNTLRRWRVWLVLFLSLVCVSACLLLLKRVRTSVAVPVETVKTVEAKEVAPPLPAKEWKLLFTRGGYWQNSEIWIANGDGTGQKRLLRNAEQPCWSPDKKQIAFARNNNIWVSNADGSGQRQVTFDWKPVGQFDEDAVQGIAWNPNDSTLTFGHDETFLVRRKRNSDAGEIETVSLLSILPQPVQQGRSAVEILYDLPDGSTSYGFSKQAYPAWSRSGKYLVFARNGDVWIAERGEKRKGNKGWDAWNWEASRLCATATFEEQNIRRSRYNIGATGFTWAPDEKSLVCSLDGVTGLGNASLVLLTLAQTKGGLTVQHQREIANGVDPCFSPDGRWIIYSDINYMTLYISSLDGKTQRTLLENGGSPVW